MEELTLERRNDMIESQLKFWKDSFIDIRIRNNNMLNQDPKTSNAIVLEVNNSFTYSRFWDIAVGGGNAEEYALKSKAVAVPGTNPIAWHAEKDVNCRNPEVLEGMVKRAYKAILQKGENPLCLAFGKLRWRVTVGRERFETNDEFVWVETPLLFIPIKLNQNSSSFWLKPVDDDAFINPTLCIRYEKETGKQFPLPSCGQWLDKEGFDIEGYFSEIAEQFDNVDFSFNPDYVALDIFDYERICMYRDVSRNFEALKKNKIIRSFFGERLCEPGKVKGLDNLLPNESFAVLDTNSSQSDVIERFKNGESFILEGPPGTGKTQTIVNMIAEAIMANKKVLFVSGKMSALNTVQKKLQMKGVSLDKHCLLIQCEKESKDINITDTYGKLKASLDAPRPVFDINEYEECKKTFVATREVLLGYNKEFYDTNNSLGLSIYDIIGRMLLLGYDEKHVVNVNFNENFIERLDKETFDNYANKIGEVETLLKSLLGRSGSIEQDVWYGFRHYELDDTIEKEIRQYCAESGVILRSINDIFESVAASNEVEGADKIVAGLKNYPLSMIGFVLDKKYLNDIGALYMSDLAAWKTALKKEIARAEKYDKAAKIYYAKTLGDATVDVEELKARLTDVAPLECYTIKEVKEEHGSVEFLAKNLGSHFMGADGEVAANVVNGLIENVEKYLSTMAERDLLREELLQNYTDDLLALEYKPLLEKFRVSWDKKVKDGKAPLLFNLQIKAIKKCCKDVRSTDFSIQSVYALLEKLDLYHQNKEAADALKKVLDEAGLKEITVNAKALTNLLEFLKAYLIEKEKHATSNLLFEELSFKEYLAKKLEKLGKILSVVSDLRVKADMTIFELKDLIDLYDMVSENNARIEKDENLRSIIPSLAKDVRTNWKNLLALLNMVDEVRKIIRNEERTLQDDCEIFMNVLRILVSKELNSRIDMLTQKYYEFYNNERWFDKEVATEVHSCEEMNYVDFDAWFEQISDIDHVTKYVTYRRSVRDLDQYGKQFFNQYVDFGRKEYPIDKMYDNYKISILYAYYLMLLGKSKYVGKLSGKDGVTAVENIIAKFSEADKELLDFNRRIVDLKVYNSIERRASKTGNLHGYLGSIPSNKNASVRRLFKTRSESIMQLTPCIMMSVYSVSKLLEYEQYQFDVVIFDEASQIPAEDALTSIMRAKSQVVIAGDPKQMPAISYFKSKDMDESTMDEDDDMTCTSIIDFLIRSPYNTISYETLNMHYRSNHESLIKYSNEKAELYGGKLITFPSPKARTQDFGLWNYPVYEDERFKDKVLCCASGENEYEAQIVVDLIRRHIEKYPLPKTDEEIENYNSLGVIVFGRKQKKVIEDLLKKDKALSKLLMLNNPHIFMMVTADEVQGDEMSEMIISLTYGYNSAGERTNSWGHLSQQPVALYKFNVAVTRARNNLKFVHSVGAGEIEALSLNYIAEYLRQFENVSQEAFENHTEYNTRFIEAIGKICESVVGKDRVVYNYGENTLSYRVPISILSKDGQSITLGVMCEVNRGKAVDEVELGAQSGQGFSVKEYACTCNQILAAHNWDNLYETYAIQWVRNYAHEKRKLIQALNAVVDC